jgi:hypothetical protein
VQQFIKYELNVYILRFLLHGESEFLPAPAFAGVRIVLSLSPKRRSFTCLTSCLLPCSPNVIHIDYHHQCFNLLFCERMMNTHTGAYPVTPSVNAFSLFSPLLDDGS